MARAVRISHQRLLDHRARLLAEIDLARVWSTVGCCIGISRADLHQTLLDAAAPVPIRFGTTVNALAQTRDAVTVTFHDGLTRDYDIVVGADGIRSSIRRLVFGDIRPRPLGQVSWRFIAKDPCDVTTWTAMLGRSRAFLAMAGRHPRRLRCAAARARALGSAPDASPGSHPEPAGAPATPRAALRGSRPLHAGYRPLFDEP